MDFLTPERRSRLMSNVRQKGTDVELLVARELRLRGYRFRRNVRTLAGSPDLVFAQHKLAVFIDGDFWHGFRYPCWQNKITQFWKDKIEANRRRDQRNFRRLRRSGWCVVRVWQHEIKTDVVKCLRRITVKLEPPNRRRI